MIRRTFASRALALVILGGAASRAPAAHADTIKFASLPTGQVTQHPVGEAPKAIAAAEKVPGFIVARPPSEPRTGGKFDFVMMFSSAKAAKDFSTGNGFGMTDETHDVCFSERAVDLDIDESGGPAEWSPSLEPGVHMAPHFLPVPRSKTGKATSFRDMPRKFEVTAVHQERFVDLGGGKAQLEMQDAWVDPSTRGARPIGAKATLTLAKVADAPGGLVIYAARERTHVQFVVHRAPSPERDPSAGPTSFAERRQQEMSRMPILIEASSGMHDASTCGFARIPLHAEHGVGEMARIDTQVVSVMPPEDQPEKKESPLQALLGNDAAQDLNQPELHVRPMSINLSTSWTTRDKEPVISITFGWAGRDKKM